MMVKLENVVDRITGNVDRFNTDREYYIGGEHYESSRIAIYTPGLLKSEKGYTLGFKFHFPFQKGDVLFMARNPHLRKAGMAMFDGICSDASYVLRTKDESVLLQNYLALIVQSDRFWDFFEANKSGSVNYLMNWKELKNYEFDLPPIEKQREIADMAWSIEETRVAYEKLLKATDDLVKSQFIEMFGDLRRNSKGYDLKPLSQLLLIERGGSPRPIADFITESDDGVNWIKIGDADEGSIYITHTKEKIKPEGTKKSRYVKPGDFLLSNSMSFGRPYILTIDGYIHDGWLVLRDERGVFNKKFLYALLSSDYATLSFEAMAAGSVVKNLNKDLVGRLKVPVPAMDEQDRYADFLERSDKSKFELGQTIEELKRTYKKLISDKIG